MYTIDLLCSETGPDVDASSPTARRAGQTCTDSWLNSSRRVALEAVESTLNFHTFNKSFGSPEREQGIPAEEGWGAAKDETQHGQRGRERGESIPASPENQEELWLCFLVLSRALKEK